MRRINVESKRMFLESFETIRGYFRELFRKLFGGGEADLILEDPEDVLECSIDVVARPPGKELRSISLLSGGEKTLTAVALLLSIFKSRTSPFCLLDEVDAALDDANIGRFVNVLREFQQNTQFIMITHRKPTMAVTDVLYGVTMEESGVSRRLSLRFEDVDEHARQLHRRRKERQSGLTDSSSASTLFWRAGTSVPDVLAPLSPRTEFPRSRNEQFFRRRRFSGLCC